jgi:ankyrin repeat protein
MNTLHAAAEAGDLGSVRAWIEKDPAAVDARDAGSRTPLHWAALAGRETVARFLVGRGADVRARDGKGGSALDLAVSCDAPGLALFLLAAGAEADPPPAHSPTPLHHAARKGYLGVVEELLRRGADVRRRDGERGNYTPLHHAAQEGHAKVIKALLAAGPEVDAPAEESTPLVLAIGAGHLEAARTLLAHGAAPDGRCPSSGNSIPLHLACTWNQTDDIIRLLLASGANPRLHAADDKTPAATARAHGKRAFAKLLERASGETPGKTPLGKWL